MIQPFYDPRHPWADVGLQGTFRHFSELAQQTSMSKREVRDLNSVFPAAAVGGFARGRAQLPGTFSGGTEMRTEGDLCRSASLGFLMPAPKNNVAPMALFYALSQVCKTSGFVATLSLEKPR